MASRGIEKGWRVDSIEYGVATYKMKWPAMYFCVGGTAPKAEPERRAVIRLLESAPELSEAAEAAEKLLAMLLDNGGDNESNHATLSALREAVAKARGTYKTPAPEAR